MAYCNFSSNVVIPWGGEKKSSNELLYAYFHRRLYGRISSSRNKERLWLNESLDHFHIGLISGQKETCTIAL